MNGCRWPHGGGKDYEMEVREGATGSLSSPARRRFFRILCMLNLLIMVLVTPADGRNFTVRRNLQGYTFSVTMKQNPPILGKNDITVEIKDSHGKYVVDAPVTVNYFMPPMPGMPPMNYRVKASPGGSEYAATMDFIMKGPWNIVIRSSVAGKPVRMTVLIDVR